MKKKLSMIVFVAVLIAFTCMYAIVDKNNAIYDRAVDTSQYVALDWNREKWSLRVLFQQKIS